MTDSQPANDDKGVRGSISRHRKGWIKDHSRLLVKDVESLGDKRLRRFGAQFEKLPNECKVLLIQLRPLLYSYYKGKKDERTIHRKEFLPKLFDALRFIRDQYCRRRKFKYTPKEGDELMKIFFRYELKENAVLPNASKFLNEMNGQSDVLDFSTARREKQTHQ